MLFLRILEGLFQMLKSMASDSLLLDIWEIKGCPERCYRHLHVIMTV